jgi:hypothetical protein|tara:strand:+ start:2329 stop:2727 length:399 start_codon:yes stop_codon:yes gene_type:complete
MPRVGPSDGSDDDYIRLAQALLAAAKNSDGAEFKGHINQAFLHRRTLREKLGLVDSSEDEDSQLRRYPSDFDAILAAHKTLMASGPDDAYTRFREADPIMAQFADLAIDASSKPDCQENEGVNDGGRKVACG